MVSFFDCLWIGCFWLVVMKCLMFAGVDVCMLGVVRFGVSSINREFPASQLRFPADIRFKADPYHAMTCPEHWP